MMRLRWWKDEKLHQSISHQNLIKHYKYFFEEIMDYKDCLQQIQKYLENSPLIVLGSGSSADYGIPLMNELSDEIKRHKVRFDPLEFESL